jgi:uncharacterized protein YcfJ
MKKTVLFPLLGLAAFAAGAQEVGQVLSSVPVIQQVAVPRQVCTQQPVAVQPSTSGGGAVIGAIIGGVVGNQIGHGSGRAAATAVGVMGGAVLGNTVEANNQQAQVQNATQCSTQTFYENRTVGYNVTYEYAGRQYQAQLPYDPGPTIRLQVTPMAPGRPAGPPAGPPVGQPYGPGPVTAPPVGSVPQVMVEPGSVGGPTVYEPTAVVVPAPMAAPVYYVRPGYYPPPVSLSFGFGYYGGHRHRH